jgi:hypothetical protein
MAKLSEWMQVMLGEIARKREEAARAAAEQKQREAPREARQQPVSSAAR